MQPVTPTSHDMPKAAVQGQAYGRTPQMLGPPPCLPLNSRCQFRLTSPFLMCRGQGPSSLPTFLRVVSQCSLLALSTSARALRTQGTIHLCRRLVFFSLYLFSFPFPSKQNCLAAAPASVPKAVPKGPSCPAKVMAVIPLMGGKTDGTRCPKCMKQAGIGRPQGGGKCCRNTPSFGALLGLERAAALAKTCFCQQKPHFTNIQQHKNP